MSATSALAAKYLHGHDIKSGMALCCILLWLALHVGQKGGGRGSMQRLSLNAAAVSLHSTSVLMGTQDNLCI